MTALSEKVAKILGLPPNADNDTILAEIGRLDDAAAEREVGNAINAGAIAAAHRQVWLNAFKADHKGTAAALTSIAPRVSAAVRTYAAPVARSSALPADPVVAAYAAECGVSDEEANDMLWRLGARAGLKPPKATIAPLIANPDGSAWTPTRPTI
jgi:hypothetical protein